MGHNSLETEGKIPRLARAMRVPPCYLCQIAKNSLLLEKLTLASAAGDRPRKRPRTRPDITADEDR